MQIHRLEVPQCSVGEGPLWDVDEQAFFWIDIVGRKVLRHDPRTAVTRTWEVPDIVGSMALRAGGGAIVALAGGVHTLDLSSGACVLLAASGDLNSQVQLADGKVDRRGRFVVGSSDRGMKETRGKLYVLDPTSVSLREIDAGITLSNGPCWSRDYATFYHADSVAKTIFAYDYDLTAGSVTNRRVFARTDALGGIPDGATVDAEDHVWSAICEGGKVVRYRPDGTIERTIDLPVRLPGGVMFGGPHLDQLFVTSVSPAFLGRPADPLDGCTFVIEGLDIRGLPEPRFAA